MKAHISVGDRNNCNTRIGSPIAFTVAELASDEVTQQGCQLDEAELERQGDGRYRAVIKGQDFPALCGFYGVTRAPCVEVEPRGPDCIQGTQADGYELQRGFGIGRYSAVVTPGLGQGYVFLDPSALPRSDGPGQVTFPDASLRSSSASTLVLSVIGYPFPRDRQRWSF